MLALAWAVSPNFSFLRYIPALIGFIAFGPPRFVSSSHQSKSIQAKSLRAFLADSNCEHFWHAAPWQRPACVGSNYLAFCFQLRYSHRLPIYDLIQVRATIESQTSVIATRRATIAGIESLAAQSCRSRLRVEMNIYHQEMRERTPANPALFGYKCYSQFDEDGRIARICEQLGIKEGTFVESAPAMALRTIHICCC